MAKKSTKKSPIIHRSKLPSAKKGQFESELIPALKQAEQNMLDTAGPTGTAAKLVLLNEQPANPSQLILPPDYEPGIVSPPGSRANPRLKLPGQSHYQRGDIIEYKSGRCRYHVVVSIGTIRGIKKIPCYTYDMALRVSEKMVGERVQPMTDAERQAVARPFVERPRG